MIERLKQAWRKNPKATVVGGILGPVAILIVIFSALALSKPHLVSTSTGSDQRVSLLSPVRFNFSSPVSRRSFQATIDPPIVGSWEWGDSVVSHLQSQVSFIPDTSWQPDQSYTVSLTAQNILENQTEQFVSTFQTESVPSIASTSVTGGVDISPVDPIKVSLTAANDGAVDFSFVFDPPLAVETVLSADGLTYSLTPAEPMRSGATYQLKITRELTLRQVADQTVVSRTQAEEAFTTAFTTRSPAQLASFSPQGSAVLPGLTAIDIRFKESMERSSVESHTTFSPELSGSWQWVDDKEVKYVLAKPLEFDTTYRTTIAASTRAQSGATFANETIETFRTVGNLRVTSVTPKNKTAGVLRGTSVTLTFDQPTDRNSVESSFSLTPKVDGVFSWREQVLTFTPLEPLNFSTTYTVNLATSAKSALGKPLGGPFLAIFTTEGKTVLLDIATRHQEHALSCEAAVLRMALGYKGIQVSENDIMAVVGYDPTIRAGNVWGDPYQAFVGDINGRQNTSGYGVYWGPIARAARTWRPAHSFSGWNVSQLASQIDAGNPVIVWGTFGRASPDSWQTPSGQQISAWKGEHARLLVGYRGATDNPTGLILNDPIAGRLSWSVAQFQANSSSFNNSGVVVE